MKSSSNYTWELMGFFKPQFVNAATAPGFLAPLVAGSILKGNVRIIRENEFK